MEELHVACQHLERWLPCWCSGKESTCPCRRHKRRGFDTWVGKIPCRRVWQPTQYSCLENPMEPRSLVGYRPWGHKELVTTEHACISWKIRKILLNLPAFHSFGRTDWSSSSSRFSSVTQSCLTLRDPMARPPRPSPTPRVYSNPCPSSRWCHPTISSSVIPFSSCLQSFPTSESFQMSQFFVSGGQSVGVSASASVLPMNIQCWFPLGWTGLISCCPRDSQESSPAPQFKSINSSALSLLYGPPLPSVHD